MKQFFVSPNSFFHFSLQHENHLRASQIELFSRIYLEFWINYFILNATRV